MGGENVIPTSQAKKPKSPMGGENEILTWQAKKPMPVVDENAIPTL